jgi:hypothetical protein
MDAREFFGQNFQAVVSGSVIDYDDLQLEAMRVRIDAPQALAKKAD